MKLEIEITEEELKSAIERKVRSSVADVYGTDAYIKDQLRKQWKEAVDTLVAEALNNSDVLREKISAQLERKLGARLEVAMKKAEVLGIDA